VFTRITIKLAKKKVVVDRKRMELVIFSKVLKDLPMIEAVKVSDDVGYEGIELHDCHFPAGIDPERVMELSRLSKGLKIKLVNLATFVGGFSTLSESNCEGEFRKFEKYLDYANALGVPNIRLDPGRPEPEKATEEAWERASSWIAKAADLARPHDVSIVLEMHEGGLIATVDSTLKLLSMIDRKNVVVNYDVGNMFHVPTDYGVGVLRKIEDYVKFVHVRDEKGRGKDGEWIYTLFGDGILDYRPIFRRLKGIGFNGYLSAECHLEPTGRISSSEIAVHEFGKIKELWESC